MAVDRQQLMKDLRSFYDFTNKTVLFVGAGNGRLLDPTVQTRKLIAIDKDRETLKLKVDIAAQNTLDSIELKVSSFEAVELSGDVVYFEFCLHEMTDPYGTLVHARYLAPEIVVFDHLPDSEWSFYAAEEERVRRSTEAMERFGVRRCDMFHIEQRFSDHPELHAKLMGQGTVAIERAQHFLGATGIVIPMSYQLALL